MIADRKSRLRRRVAGVATLALLLLAAGGLWDAGPQGKKTSAPPAAAPIAPAPPRPPPAAAEAAVPAGGRLVGVVTALEQARRAAEREAAGPPALPADDDRRWQVLLRNDAIARHCPMLAERTPAERLETLRWMLTLPQGKLVAAFPEISKARHLPWNEREQLARELAASLIAALEAEGHQAPVLPAGFVAARIDPGAPAADLPRMLADHRPPPAASASAGEVSANSSGPAAPAAGSDGQPPARRAAYPSN